MASILQATLMSLLAVAIAGSALAQPPAGGVANVEVVASRIPPKVVATYPASGAVIPGGPIVLKVVFDQVMTPKAWSYTPAAQGRFPDCLDHPRLLNDHKTFVLLCSVATNGSYGLQINATPDFSSAGGRSAPPFPLTFTTSDVLTISLEDAMKQAGLSDADDPIMSETAAPEAIQASRTPASDTP